MILKRYWQIKRTSKVVETYEIAQAIKEARPKLKRVSPLVAKIVIGFGVINILLGIGLATTQASLATPLVVAPEQFYYQLWGFLFFTLGVAMLWLYARNSWRGMRYTFVIGMCFKFMWAIALVVRYFSGEFSNPLVLIIWLFMAYIQAVTYLHFMPQPALDKGAKDAGI